MQFHRPWRAGLEAQSAGDAFVIVKGDISGDGVKLEGSGGADGYAGTTVGAPFFIAENIALSGAFVAEWASEDIYAEDEDFEDTNAKLEVAMRFYF